MRKIYSLVLTATLLLIGINVWADVHAVQDSGDKAKVKVGSGDWMFASTLNDAFDYVQPGQTARIELLNDVNLTAPITMPATINSTVLAGTCQNITLNLNNHNITAEQNVTAFRLVKGTLNIEGRGTISKESVGAATSSGGAVIVVFGAEDKTAANWSNLSIGKDVTVSITPGVKKGTGIMITEMSEFNYNTNTLDILYASPADRLTKYGYCTYYYNAIIVSGGDTWITEDNKSTYMTAENGVPMICGALANFKNGDDKTGLARGIQQGAAFGVKVTIEGTVIAGKRGLQINGNINQKPICTEDDNITKRDPARYPNAPYYQYQYPYINITSTAHLNSSNEGGCAGIYASGYAVFDIAGEVYGATGVYMKAGDVKLIDADIYSTCDTYETSNGGTSGIGNAGGSAIAIESNDAYAGGSGLNITGDTKVTGGAGYAIADETYKNDGTSTTSAVTIEGGTIEAGDAGAIIITDGTAPNTTVVGGTFDADQITVTHGDEPATTTAVNTYTPENTHTIVIEDGNKTVIVISEGEAPATDTENPTTTWAFIASKSDAVALPSYAWTEIESDQIGDGTIANAQTIYLGELLINSGSENNLQTLTITNHSTLQVNHLIMNNYARIIVEAGGKLVVKGEQGIIAPSSENIVLKASETAQAIFLFHPEVKSNRHPNAKVEYHSNSFYSDHNVQQFFGIPTYKGTVSNIETESTAAIYFDVWRNPGWDYIGAMNVPVTPSDPSVLANLDKFDLPFGLCCITSKNDADHKPVFTFSGELTGNMDHNFTLHQGWTSMANAYTGPIDKNAIVAKLAAWNASYGTEQSVYTYDLNESTGAIQWHARSKYALPTNGINAMQPIMFHNGSDVEGVVLDYSDLVWDPFVAANPSAAPARQAISNITKAQINIAGENEADYTTIVADSELGDDRSFCAPKYDNAGLQLYVMGNEKYDVYAADEIENSYIGFRTVNAGMYTISFENVEGEDLVLVDLVNGARTNMAEGAIYTFHAGANETNDYRFQVVAAAKMPTSIENTEAQSTKKAGVYTLTGQYLGNASIFNALPAGVYVVDGVKKVK